MKKYTKMEKQSKNKEMTPLQKIKRERELLRRECLASEAKLADQWNYLSDNVGTLLFNSAANSVRRRMFGGSKRKIQSAEVEDQYDDEDEMSLRASMSLGQKLMNGFLVSAPMIWEIAQPMLMNMAMEKIKSIFRRNPDKKKKKK